jgi:hypothetical protein
MGSFDETLPEADRAALERALDEAVAIGDILAPCVVDSRLYSSRSLS